MIRWVFRRAECLFLRKTGVKLKATISGIWSGVWSSPDFGFEWHTARSNRFDFPLLRCKPSTAFGFERSKTSPSYINQWGKEAIQRSHGQVSVHRWIRIMRKIIELEQQGGRKSFLEKNPLKVNDFVPDCRWESGNLNYPNWLIFKVVPKLFSTFMLQLTIWDLWDISQSRAMRDNRSFAFHRWKRHLVFSSASNDLLEKLKPIG